MNSYKRFVRYKEKGNGSLIYITGTVKSIESGFSGNITDVIVEVESSDKFSQILLNLRNMTMSTIDLEAMEKQGKEIGFNMNYRKAQGLTSGDTIEILAKRLYTTVDKYGNIKRDCVKPVAIATGRSKAERISYFQEYAWFSTFLRKAKPKAEKQAKSEPAKELKTIEV